jgi:hypothetical protein
MIQSMQWIAKTSTTSFPLGIVSIGPLLGEIQMATAKMGTKWVPGKERVKPPQIMDPFMVEYLIPTLVVQWAARKKWLS